MKYIMAAIPGEFDEDCTPVCTPVGLYTLDGFTKFLKETTVKSIKDFRGSGDDIFFEYLLFIMYPDTGSTWDKYDHWIQFFIPSRKINGVASSRGLLNHETCKYAFDKDELTFDEIIAVLKKELV